MQQGGRKHLSYDRHENLCDLCGLLFQATTWKSDNKYCTVKVLSGQHKCWGVEEGHLNCRSDYIPLTVFIVIMLIWLGAKTWTSFISKNTLIPDQNHSSAATNQLWVMNILLVLQGSQWQFLRHDSDGTKDLFMVNLNFMKFFRHICFTL